MTKQESNQTVLHRELSKDIIGELPGSTSLIPTTRAHNYAAMVRHIGNGLPKIGEGRVNQNETDLVQKIKTNVAL